MTLGFSQLHTKQFIPNPNLNLISIHITRVRETVCKCECILLFIHSNMFRLIFYWTPYNVAKI